MIVSLYEVGNRGCCRDDGQNGANYKEGTPPPVEVYGRHWIERGR